MIHIPTHFAEQDSVRLQALMRADNFGTLVSVHQGDIQVSHLPFMLDSGRKVLRGHMARSNPQWQSFAPDRDVLVVFHGPHHYISPSWYGTHPSVPTWNYAVVHVTGKPALIRDPGEIEALLRQLVEHHEAPSPTPWRMELPADYQQKMISAVVGFEIAMEKVEGKFKLSQNRPAADRPRVAEALEQIGNDQALGIAALMRENLASS